MGRFDRASDPPSPVQPRPSGDDVPLLPLRRGRRESQNRNVWNDDTHTDQWQAKKSDDSFPDFLEDAEEDTDSLLANREEDISREPGQTEPDMEFEDEAKVLEDDSPYEEVRAAVSNTDDSSMACVFLSSTQLIV